MLSASYQKQKITVSLAALVKMKVRIVNRCDSGKEPITLWVWAEFTNRHRNSRYDIAVKHNRRLVLRDEQTGNFLYSADYCKTWYTYFVGFAYTGEVLFIYLSIFNIFYPMWRFYCV